MTNKKKNLYIEVRKLDLEVIIISVIFYPFIVLMGFIVSLIPFINSWLFSDQNDESFIDFITCIKRYKVKEE